MPLPSMGWRSAWKASIWPRAALKRLGLIGKGIERDRRPTTAELGRLFRCFDENARLTMPMTRIVQFAIATAIRLDEICRADWSDLDIDHRMLLIRDRKDPRTKAGNDQRIPLFAATGFDAWALVMVRAKHLGKAKGPIFPYNSRSVGTAFRRACADADIKDLHFHDLRHEGAPNIHGPMPEASVARFGPLVPEFVRTIRARFGRFSWFDGLFQAIAPARYAGVVRAALAGDPDLDPDRMVPLALGGFGQLEVWHPDFGVVTLMTLPNWVICNPQFQPRKHSPDNITAGLLFTRADDQNADREDAVTGGRMFRKLVRQHGALPPDTVFAPRLHPAVGGAQAQDNFRPAAAPEAIALMHKAEPLVLVDLTTPAARPARRIGRPG